MIDSEELRRRPTSPEQAVRFLSLRLRTTLALLCRGSDELVALTLSALPQGSRLVLESLGALEVSPDNPDEVMPTSFGRELIAACVIEGLPQDLQKKLTALEEERARRTADDCASTEERVDP